MVALPVLLALVPLAIFAGAGVDWIVESWSRQRTAVLVVSAVGVVAALPLGLRFGRSTAVVARHDLGLTTAGRRAIEDREDAKYPTARALRAYLAEQHIRGDIYVLGNPIDQFVTGRDQAIPTNGWSPEQYDREVWSRVADAIRRDRPPLLVIDDYSAGIMRHRTPSTLAVVNRLYRPAKRVGDDTWYVRRS